MITKYIKRYLSCEGCFYFDTVGYDKPVNDNLQYGNCRRYPPAYFSEDHPDCDDFPITTAVDWCGEWLDTKFYDNRFVTPTKPDPDKTCGEK